MENEKIRTTIILDKKIIKNIKTIAALRNTTQQEILKKMASDWLDNCEEMKIIKALEKNQ